MFWFHETNRRKIINLIREMISNETIFENFLAKYKVARQEISKEEIEASVIDSKSKNELSKVLIHAREMFSEDNQLVHLLLELRKKGLLNFSNEKKSEAFSEILEIAKDLLSKSHDLALFFKHLNQKYAKLPIKSTGKKFNPDLDETGGLDSEILQYQHRLEVLIESEKKDLIEIEQEVLKGTGISEEKIFELRHGSLKVEVHKGYAKSVYQDPYKKFDVYKSAILIFDYDFLVAEIGLWDDFGKIVRVNRSDAHIRNHGYVQIAIELLLKEKKIEHWYSDTIPSKAARKMYERLKSKSEYVVEFSNGKYSVMLK